MIRSAAWVWCKASSAWPAISRLTAWLHIKSALPKFKLCARTWAAKASSNRPSRAWQRAQPSSSAPPCGGAQAPAKGGKKGTRRKEQQTEKERETRRGRRGEKKHGPSSCCTAEGGGRLQVARAVHELGAREVGVEQGLCTRAQSKSQPPAHTCTRHLSRRAPTVSWRGKPVRCVRRSFMDTSTAHARDPASARRAQRRACTPPKNIVIENTARC